VRTLLHLIQLYRIEATIKLPHAGATTISNITPPLTAHVWFAGVSALFLQGVRDLAELFPQKFVLKIVYHTHKKRA